MLGVVCFCTGRYKEAIDAFKRNVNRGDPLALPALVFRTASYSAVGYIEEAKTSAKALLNFFPAFSLARYRMLHIFKNPEDGTPAPVGPTFSHRGSASANGQRCGFGPELKTARRRSWLLAL